MSNAVPSRFKSLERKPVVVKLPGWPRALPATVVAIDDTGFWFVGNEIMTALKEANGASVSRITPANLYVPFSQIEWLLAAEPQEIADAA